MLFLLSKTRNNKMVHPIEPASAFSFPKIMLPEFYQTKKIIAVALACLAFFGLQFCYSWTAAAGIAVACSTITLLSETFLRTDDEQKLDWFSWDQINTINLVIGVALRLLLLPVAVTLMTACGRMPLQNVALKIMAGDLRLILLAILVAPIAEEILFRGFIHERIEDLLNLVDRHVIQVTHLKGLVSVALPSMLFGLIHITGAQVVKSSMRIVIFCMATAAGFMLLMKKKIDQSLLSPIAIHSTQNTGFTLGLLAARRLMILR
jgi:membrane protease YdiL (CAAX protease family)